VRRALARQLGTIDAEIDEWVGVLAPMMADMDLAVQVEAASTLSRSKAHWRLTLDVFAQVLESDAVPDEHGDSLHARVLWSLTNGKVPQRTARALIKPHAARLEAQLGIRLALAEQLPARDPKRRTKSVTAHLAKKKKPPTDTTRPRPKRGTKKT
jgi:hypothetical protein